MLAPINAPRPSLPAFPWFFAALLAIFACATVSAASDIPDPATLPEKVQKGDGDPYFPAESARRLAAGKAFLESGEVERALEEFARAEKADSSQVMVYFYQAVATYRVGNYPEAMVRANLGLGVLTDIYSYGEPTAETDAQQARFVELRDAIQAKLDTTGGKAVENPLKKKQEAAAALKEGDEAYAKGLLAKAAAAYARSFRADPTQGEIGLRAAGLYADRLKNPFEAALLWQQVIAGGEPHATTARAEIQSHHDALDAVLKNGLAQREEWRRTQNPAEPLRLAAAFPDSTELQTELALLAVRKGQVADAIAYLQAASRLGLGADDFLAQPAFVEFLVQAGLDSPTGQPLTAFVRDAYGDATLEKIRTEAKRRADETARLAREKAEKEREAKLASERRELVAWRDALRLKTVQAASAILGARNGTELELVNSEPTAKKSSYHHTMARSTYFSHENGYYRFTSWQRSTSTRRSTGNSSPTVEETVWTLPSFAPFSGATVAPSTWGPGSLVLANAAWRPLGKSVVVSFRSPANLHRRHTLTYEFETTDGSQGYRDESSNNYAVTLDVFLDDSQAARLQALLGQLAALDAAGDDVNKLRALRAKP